MQPDLTNLIEGAVVLHHEDEGLVRITELGNGVSLFWLLAGFVIVEVVKCWKRKADDMAVTMGPQHISEFDACILPISDKLLGDDNGMTLLDVYVLGFRVVVVAREDSEINAFLLVKIVAPGTIVDSSN